MTKCLRRRASYKEMYWEVEKDEWPTEEMVYLSRDRRKEIQAKCSRCPKAQDSAQNIHSYSEECEAWSVQHQEKIQVWFKKSVTRLCSEVRGVWWHRIISSDIILVIHNQSLNDIWSIKMCGVSTFQFLSLMTKRNNSHHTTPASAFIWSPAIFVFITHSAVTHTEILVTS